MQMAGRDAKRQIEAACGKIIAEMIRISAPPYTRPTARPSLSRPWTPEGQLLLREALERFGGRKFGKDWTGEEAWARHGSFGPPQPPSEPEGSFDGPSRTKNSEGRVIEKPVRYIVEGESILLPYDEAVRRFEAEKDELTRLWQEEMEAARRYRKAWSQFRQVLHSERVSGFVLSKSGSMHPIRAYQWAADDAWNMLKNGRTKVVVGGGYSTSEAEGWVIISESDLESYFKPGQSDTAPVLEQARQVAAHAAPSVSTESRVAPGGRPQKWDWDAFWVRLCLIIHNDGIPETQAELVRKLQDWFGTTHGDMPHESDIKKRVSKFFRAFREEEN